MSSATEYSIIRAVDIESAMHAAAEDHEDHRALNEDTRMAVIMLGFLSAALPLLLPLPFFFTARVKEMHFSSGDVCCRQWSKGCYCTALYFRDTDERMSDRKRTVRTFYTQNHECRQ